MVLLEGFINKIIVDIPFNDKSDNLKFRGDQSYEKRHEDNLFSYS